MDTLIQSHQKRWWIQDRTATVVDKIKRCPLAKLTKNKFIIVPYGSSQNEKWTTEATYLVTHLPPYVARCLQLSFMITWILRKMSLSRFVSSFSLCIWTSPFSSNVQLTCLLNNIGSFRLYNGPTFLKRIMLIE
jgi:hypothetical protein